MAKLVVWAQGREWTLDAPDALDRAELARGLTGEYVSHVDVRGWLDVNKHWMPTLDGAASLGRIRRDAIVAIWVDDS